MNHAHSTPRRGPITAFADAVSQGLGRRPRRLQWWPWRDAEAAVLLDRLSEIEGYCPADTEGRVLAEHGAEIMAQARADEATRTTVIELDAGSAKNSGLLLEHCQDALYVPIDLNPRPLAQARKRFGKALPGLEVVPFAASHADALAAIECLPGARVVVMLGSNIGFYEQREGVELLRGVALAAGEGAALVLGTDLVKSARLTLPPYRGAVMSALAKSALMRINRELGGSFDPEAFEPIATWNTFHTSVELHLQSVRRQEVPVRGLGLAFRFDEGELVHVGSALKYDLAKVGRLLTAAGLVRERTFLDPSNFYAVHVARVVNQKVRLH